MISSFRSVVALGTACAFFLTGCSPRVVVSVDPATLSVDRLVALVNIGDEVSIELVDGGKRHGRLAHCSDSLIVVLPKSEPMIGLAHGDSIRMRDVETIHVLESRSAWLGVAIGLGLTVALFAAFIWTGPGWPGWMSGWR